VKLEKYNLGGSVKDRAVLGMLEEAKRQGKVNSDTIIVEPTSGNTGIAVAILASVLGLKAVIIMPESMSVERRTLIKAYGAQLILTPKELGIKGSIDKAAEIREKFLGHFEKSLQSEFTLRKKLSLTIFGLAFPIMIWGVASQGWWFQEAAALFFLVSIIIMLVSGLSEKEAVNAFIAGASEVVGVALIIGLARAINIVMENGMISDTLLFYSSNLVSEMGKGLFAVVLLFIFVFLGIFIPSTSGLAVFGMSSLSLFSASIANNSCCAVIPVLLPSR